MNRKNVVEVVAQPWALACMLFIGVFGGAMPIFAAEREQRQTVRDAKKGGEIAEHAIRLVSIRAVGLPIRPLLEKLREIKSQIGIGDGQQFFGSVEFGEPIVRGLTASLDLGVLGQTTSGSVTYMPDLWKARIPFSASIIKGQKEYVSNLFLGLDPNGDLETSGSISVISIPESSSPPSIYSASGRWTHFVEGGKLAMFSQNTAAAGADLLADEMTEGMESCEAATASVCVAVGIAIFVVGFLAALCYVLCWLFWAVLPWDMKPPINRFFGPEGGGETCYA